MASEDEKGYYKDQREGGRRWYWVLQRHEEFGKISEVEVMRFLVL